MSKNRNVFFGEVAQSVEHVTENHGVPGSIPGLAIYLNRSTNVQDFGGGVSVIAASAIGGVTTAPSSTPRIAL
jgi:hypothetical protein